MNRALNQAQAAYRLRAGSLLLLFLAPPLVSCGGGDSVLAAGAPLIPADSVGNEPIDSAPPLDPGLPPVDSVAPPIDSVVPPAGAHVGIPFGPFGLPAKLYGHDFNATFRALPPKILLSELEAARQAGARVVIRLVGGHRRYKTKKGKFGMEEWKARLDRYRGIDISSYIDDGTIVGHFILDEPHDKSNWGGTTIPPSAIDEMARYSKDLWPTMATIVRGWPAYLKGYDYKYLDAAWAQYSERFGPITGFINDNVRDAKASGLALVVGLNLLDGGTKGTGIKGYTKGKHGMSAAEVKAWGDALLSEPYACAFLSWKYTEQYFSRAAIRAALQDLSEKAKGLPNKACRRR